jgi:hypothetical protein
LSKLPDSGTGLNNIKLSIRRRFVQKYKANSREMAPSIKSKAESTRPKESEVAKKGKTITSKIKYSEKKQDIFGSEN